MKRILLILFVLFSFATVNASMGTSVSNINIENISINVKKDIGYKDEVTIAYSINPRDADNLYLVWDVTGIKKGVTVEFVTSKTTGSSDGQIVIKVNNTLDKSVTLKLTAKQEGKVLSTTKLVVETKEETLERVSEQVNALINGLNEKINKDTYEENSKKIEIIDSLLEENPEVKDMMESWFLEEYENIKNEVNEYKENNKTFVLVVSGILIVIFSLLIFWIFKREDD